MGYVLETDAYETALDLARTEAMNAHSRAETGPGVCAIAHALDRIVEALLTAVPSTPPRSGCYECEKPTDGFLCGTCAAGTLAEVR